MKEKSDRKGTVRLISGDAAPRGGIDMRVVLDVAVRVGAMRGAGRRGASPVAKQATNAAWRCHMHAGDECAEEPLRKLSEKIYFKG